MHQAILVFSILLLIGCKQNQTAIQQTSSWDSLIKLHLKNTESSEFYDTTDYDYKMLRAYFNNDSSFFVDMKKDMEFNPKDLIPRLDSCVLQKKLSYLQVDEAYRFRHGQPFCPIFQNITVTRVKDNIHLHFIEFSNGEGVTIKYKDGTEIKPNCTITKEFEKKLTLNDWDVLERKIEESDYWGLKSHTFRTAFDPSWWEVHAFTKRPREPFGQQLHVVSRGFPNLAFRDIGKYMMKLSGEKSMCGELE